jgi:dCTP deaminase
MLKNDRWIRTMASNGMIAPFEAKQISARVDPAQPKAAFGALSFGVSSYGYDVRASTKFRIFTPTWGTVVDPKEFKPSTFIEHEADVCVIPPNSFVLTSSIERIVVPRGVLVLVIGKSTYARCGIVCGCTPLEPEWEGHITIELSNTTPLPAKVYANEGVAQLLFLAASEACEVSYADRKGKYQNQSAHPVTPLLEAAR